MTWSGQTFVHGARRGVAPSATPLLFYVAAKRILEIRPCKFAIPGVCPLSNFRRVAQRATLRFLWALRVAQRPFPSSVGRTDGGGITSVEACGQRQPLPQPQPQQENRITARIMSHTQLSLNRLQRQLFMVIPPCKIARAHRRHFLPVGSPFCYHFMRDLQKGSRSSSKKGSRRREKGWKGRSFLRLRSKNFPKYGRKCSGGVLTFDTDSCII